MDVYMGSTHWIKCPKCLHYFWEYDVDYRQFHVCQPGKLSINQYIMICNSRYGLHTGMDNSIKSISEDVLNRYFKIFFSKIPYSLFLEFCLFEKEMPLVEKYEFDTYYDLFKGGFEI